MLKHVTVTPWSWYIFIWHLSVAFLPYQLKCMSFQLSENEKRRSLLWHGFDRFSRKLRGEFSPSCIVSPTHKSVHRTTSNGESRRSLSENDSTPVRIVGSAGTQRRQLFSSNKQYSMPAEVLFFVFLCVLCAWRSAWPRLMDEMR